MNQKQTLLTEKNIKLFIILCCWVMLLQLLFDNIRTKAEDIQEEVEIEEIVDNNQDDELYNCKHWDWEIYRGIKWRCNSDWYAQDIPDLQWTTREERMKELLAYYNKEYLYETFFYGGKMFGVYPELAICIAKADTNLWRQLKTQWNLWNVWNKDDWSTQSFDSEYKWIKAIYQTLNNSYLWKYQYIAELSRKFNKDWYIYASSIDNRHNNVVNCMWVIRWETVDDYFAFRF